MDSNTEQIILNFLRIYDIPNYQIQNGVINIQNAPLYIGHVWSHTQNMLSVIRFGTVQRYFSCLLNGLNYFEWFPQTVNGPVLLYGRIEMMFIVNLFQVIYRYNYSQLVFQDDSLRQEYEGYYRCRKRIETINDLINE